MDKRTNFVDMLKEAGKDQLEAVAILKRHGFSPLTEAEAKCFNLPLTAADLLTGWAAQPAVKELGKASTTRKGSKAAAIAKKHPTAAPKALTTVQVRGEDGIVSEVTTVQALSAVMIQQLVAMLRTCLGDAWGQEYAHIKRPHGTNATASTRLAAYQFAMRTAVELSAKEGSK